MRTSNTPGGVSTSTFRVADTPPTDAVSVALPGATPVIVAPAAPSPATASTAGLLDVHVTTQPFAGGGPLAVTVATSVFVPAVRIRGLIVPEMDTPVTTDAEPPDGVATATVPAAVVVPEVAEIV